MKLSGIELKMAAWEHLKTLVTNVLYISIYRGMQFMAGAPKNLEKDEEETWLRDFITKTKYDFIDWFEEYEPTGLLGRDIENDSLYRVTEKASPAELQDFIDKQNKAEAAKRLKFS